MPPLPKKSPFQLHLQKYQYCRDCNLCEKRRHIVMARGKVPCDMLFIGEAPGQSEDALGKPFAGPAGHVLDKIILRAIPESVRVAMTNLVCCIPKGEDTNKMHEPPQLAIEACQERLIDFVRVCQPRVIVLTGKLAQKHVSGQAMFAEQGTHPSWIPADKFIEFVHIVHPSAIIQAPVAQQGLMIQKSIVTLRDAVDEHLK